MLKKRTLLTLLIGLSPISGFALCDGSQCAPDLNLNSLIIDSMKIAEKYPSAASQAEKVATDLSTCTDDKLNSGLCSLSSKDIPQEVIEAKESLDFEKDSGKNFLSFLSQGQRKNSNSADAQLFQSKIDTIMDFLKKQGGRHCFPGGAEAYQKFCLATKWKDLEFQTSENNSRSLRLMNPDGSYFEKTFKPVYEQIPNTNPPQFNPIPKSYSLRNSWNLKKPGSPDILGTLMPVPMAKSEDLFKLENTKISISQMQFNETTKDHYGSQVKDHNVGLKDKSFHLSQLETSQTELCEDFPVDPRKYYELALKSDPSISLANADTKWSNPTAAGKYLTYGASAGLAETAQNYKDSGKALVDGVKGLGGLITNKEISFCQEGKDSSTPPIECDGAVPCAEPENGKWCIGTRDFLLKGLGAKKDEILKACEKEESIAWIGCLEVEVGKRAGKAAWSMMVDCAKDIGRCGAQWTTAVATIYATGGVGIAANVGGKLALGSITALLRSGTISVNVARALATATTVTVNGATVVAETVLGGMPFDAQQVAVKEMKDLLAKGVLTGAEKEAAEKIVSSAAKNVLGGSTLNSKDERINALVKKHGQAYVDEMMTNASIVDPKARMKKIESSLSDQLDADGRPIKIDTELEEKLMEIHGRGTLLETDTRVLAQKITDAQQAIKEHTGITVSRKTIEDRLVRKGLLGQLAETPDQGIESAVSRNNAVQRSHDLIKELQAKSPKPNSPEGNKLRVYQNRHEELVEKATAIEKLKIELQNPSLSPDKKIALQEKLDRQTALFLGDSNRLDIMLLTESQERLDMKVIETQLRSPSSATPHYKPMTVQNSVSHPSPTSQLSIAREETKKQVNESIADYQKLHRDYEEFLDGNKKFKSEADEDAFINNFNQQTRKELKTMVDAVHRHLDELQNNRSAITELSGGDAGKAYVLKEKIDEANSYIQKIKKKMKDDPDNFNPDKEFLEKLRRYSEY